MEASSDIILPPGGMHRVVLGGLGSAGYRWEFEVDGTPGVVAVHSDFSTHPDQTPANRSGLQTFSVDNIFLIEALKPGKADVRFLLRRPWQKDVPPVRTETVHVTVAE